jgi:hypothetical protein
MLKIQELQIDGQTFRIREPRMKDFLATRNLQNNDEYAIVMLAGMLIDEHGKEFGRAAVEELPLRYLDQLSNAVTELTKVDSAPLPQSDGSSTG